MKSREPERIHRPYLAGVEDARRACEQATKVTLRKLRGRVLLVAANNDPLVPEAMASSMAAAAHAGRVQTVSLAAGDVPFVHSSVNAADLLMSFNVERLLMRGVLSRAAKQRAAAKRKAAAHRKVAAHSHR